MSFVSGRWGVHWRHRLVVGVVVVLAWVIASCGDDRPTTATPAARSTTTVPRSRLDTVLLDAGDVGPGWRIGPVVNDADRADAARIPCPDVAVNPAIAKRLTPATGVQFEPTDGSYRHLIEFAISGEPGQLGADLGAFFDAMESCSTVSPTPPAELRVERRTIPQLGDQRAAFVLVGREAPDAPEWYVRDAVVRVGPVAIEVGLAEILSTPEQPPSTSDAEFDELLGRAVSKAGG